jgi:hypothetical protein
MTGVAMRLPAAICLLILALPHSGRAETPMSAAEFEAYATGKTLSYAEGTVVWGSEQYLPGRKVIWAFSKDMCQYGRWYEDKGGICFVYDGDVTPKCWHFFKGRTGLKAQFISEAPITELSEVKQSATPLSCPGPDVGA